jgi:hypothetical protein
MKNNVVSGAALAAAAVAIAFIGVAVAPAQAAGAGHRCTMARGACGGKGKCMSRPGVCKHSMAPHRGACRSLNHCRSR